ncbi:hypothetical protein PY793_05640 [Acetobacter fabarum]|uniref:hypothetical protein n=1 Tax=Acetobacter fabarum TaxID=483199 RepID=UPI00312BB6DE
METDIKKKFLTLHGIPSDTPPKDTFYYYDIINGWTINNNKINDEINDEIISLYYLFQDCIMKDIDYNTICKKIPPFVSDSGLNSESPVSKNMLELIINNFKNIPEIYRFLYLYDCDFLIQSLLTCHIEVKNICGEFYHLLNSGPFFDNCNHIDSVRFTCSADITKLMSYVNFIFIRLYSILDYVVKICFELDNIPNDFSKYNKMYSKNKLFGEKKRLSINNRKDTLFEDCDFIKTIETIRNHIIHDGIIDIRPKGYERYVSGVIVERFILFPDIKNGRFENYVNRKLFYGNEDKINLRLPSIIDEFNSRLLNTIKIVINNKKEII